MYRRWIASCLLLAWASPTAAGDVDVLLRTRMVEQQLARPSDGRWPIRDSRVLEAMRMVPRHAFVPLAYRELAYTDQPLPIGAEQTISQPYIVALMTELADIQPGERVLEIGTGSGYQAAVLAQLTEQIYTIEIIEELAQSAASRLRQLGYKVHVRAGDGYEGWPGVAPFDAILVTAAAPRLPQPLVDQLALNGRLVIPLGDSMQQLTVFVKTTDGLQQKPAIPVRFVPMTGKIHTQGRQQ